jgi:hypothetical protein
VIEHKDLIAEHRESIEVVRALVMGYGGCRRLQSGNMRFKGYGDLVTKTSLHPSADRSQQPGRGRRAAKPYRSR